MIEFFKNFHSVAAIQERSEKGITDVLESEKNIVGTGTAPGKEIYGVFVKPDNQKKGLGRQIMAVLKNHVRDLGHSTIELSISLPSRRF